MSAIKKAAKKVFPFLSDMRNAHMMKGWNRDLYKAHKKYNLGANKSQLNSGYVILLEGHALEKGMTSPKPREFGVAKTALIIEKLKLYEENKWAKDFAYEFGIGILTSYAHFYEEHGWIESDNYKTVKEFLSARKTAAPKVGAMTLERSKFIKDAKIDYDKFLSSRHSIRRFENKKLTSTDIKKAMQMVSKTPTACNRQMVKAYFIRNDKVKKKIVPYSKGMTNFDNDSANMIVVTYDATAFRWHEMHQGFFNAGLFSMNLVNALHSLGIGSCMLEYFAETKEEAEEKAIIGIPENEKIAVVIAAGYYPEKTVVPCSHRKSVSDLYEEV